MKKKAGGRHQRKYSLKTVNVKNTNLLAKIPRHFPNTLVLRLILTGDKILTTITHFIRVIQHFTKMRSECTSKIIGIAGGGDNSKLIVCKRTQLGTQIARTKTHI